MTADLNGHDARVAIVRAIAEVDPAAINDVVDALDRTTVDEDRDAVITALVRNVLRTGDVVNEPVLLKWKERHAH